MRKGSHRGSRPERGVRAGRDGIDPRLAWVRLSTADDHDELLRLVWRHERRAMRGEEGDDALAPAGRDERSGAPERPDFSYWGPY